jgi:hypothetical protein
LASRPKPAEGLRVFGYIVGQELKGEEATEFYVLSFVDHSHPAAAQLLDDAVVRNGLANHCRESYVCETGKSMKAEELAYLKRGCCCNVALSRIEGF